MVFVDHNGYTVVGGKRWVQSWAVSYDSRWMSLKGWQVNLQNHSWWLET